MADHDGMKCPVCGGKLASCEGGKYQCTHCHEIFTSKILDGYFQSMYNTSSSSIREAVAQEFSKQLDDAIGRCRAVLNQELGKKYPDKKIIQGLCLSIEKLWPGEIQATCIRVASSAMGPEALKQALDSIDVNTYQVYYVQGILDYLFTHVTLKKYHLAPISNLIHRAYEDKDIEKYGNYCNLLEIEANKIHKLYYDCTRDRDVFIAHATEDREKAFNLLQKLEGIGYDCFLAERDLKHGSPSEYKVKMPQAIKHCRFFILLSSTASRSADGVKDEMAEVIKQDKEIWEKSPEYVSNVKYEDIPIKFKKPRLEWRLDNFAADRTEESRYVKTFFGKQDWVIKLDAVVEWIEKFSRDIQASKDMDEAALISKGKSYEEIDWPAEISKCRKLAKQGKVDAQFVLGRCYEYGEGVRKNKAAAVSWYRKAAEEGFAPAQYCLGVCFEYGWGVGQNQTEAASWYLKAAQQDYIPAQSQLGYEYFYGKEGEEDKTKTILLLRKAAVPSSEFEIRCYIDKARLCLGNCYFYGYGVEQNFEEAVKWYETVSPHILSGWRMKQIADCYYHGRLINKDLKRAVIWYERAARDGDLEAQYQLGRCYENGEGGDKDDNEAIQWYRKAAGHGYAQAQYGLAIRYYYGNGIKQINHAKAIEWLRRSAEQEYAPAQYRLGGCYEKGEGVEKDFSEAIKQYRKAANQGLDEAQYSLGVCYYNGRGIEKDFFKAVHWFFRAAEQGNAKAQNKLAFCYERGEGLARNFSEAAKWYERAAKQGNAAAQNNFGKCLYCGHGIKKDFLRAASCFLEAAKKENSEAMYYLGECYSYGRGVKKDKVEAMRWYTEAAKRGYKSAIIKVKGRI